MEFRIVFFLLVVNLSFSQSLEISPDGGYQNIVIRIEDDAASQKDCRNILQSLSSFLASSSEALQSALSGDSNHLCENILRSNIKIFGAVARKYFIVEYI